MIRVGRLKPLRRLGVIAVGLAALASGACTTYSVGVPAGKGKAYVIKNDGSASRQTVLLCDANKGAPRCVEQREQ